MPRAGGPASKYGQRYEDRWTATYALKVLAGEASAIHLEGPNSDIGFEFSLQTPTHTEYHQVKRQRTGEGRWSLAALAEVRVLDSFHERLRSPDAHCVFASSCSAHDLDELADSARASADWPEFERALEPRLKQKGRFEELCERWGATGEWSWEALRRVRVATVGERELVDFLLLAVEVQLEGPTKQGPAALIEILRDRVDQRLEATDLWTALRAHGFSPKETGAAQPRAEAQRLNARFRRTRKATLIAGKLIPRPETATLEAALGEQRVVFLHGRAGAGKSDVLLELCERFEEGGATYLALRLDSQDPARTAQQLGEVLDLRGSPAAVLTKASVPERPAYLIIDQLDALSTTSGRNPRFFEAVADTIDLALSKPHIRVILACRSFDIENDSRFRRLASGTEDEEPLEVEVGLLSEEVVAQTLSELGIGIDGLDWQLRGLLRVPIHLSLLAGIAASGGLDGARLRSVNDLHEAYWEAKAAEVEEALGGESHWSEVLDVLVDKMSAEQALATPAAVLDGYRRDREAMCSAGVLVSDEGRLTFFHETFFDYAFARRFIGRGQSLEELLRVDQFLFRRAQVRQILDYSRRSAPELYRRSLTFLLQEDWVRFHIKDLVVAWLAGVERPEEAELSLLEPILAESAHPLHERAWATVCSPRWFSLLDSSGRLQRWLENEERRDRALSALTRAPGGAPERVAALLTPYLDASDEWRQRIAELLGRIGLASRELVELQLALIGKGGAREGSFWYTARNLHKTHPEWVCELFGAYLKYRVRIAEAAGIADPFRPGLLPRDMQVDEDLRSAAKRAPFAFFEHVWPVIPPMLERAVFRFQGEGERLVRDEIWLMQRSGGSEPSEDLLTATGVAMAELARRDPSVSRLYWVRTPAARWKLSPTSSSKVLREIHLPSPTWRSTSCSPISGDSTSAIRTPMTPMGRTGQRANFWKRLRPRLPRPLSNAWRAHCSTTTPRGSSPRRDIANGEWLSSRCWVGSRRADDRRRSRSALQSGSGSSTSRTGRRLSGGRVPLSRQLTGTMRRRCPTTIGWRRSKPMPMTTSGRCAEAVPRGWQKCSNRKPEPPQSASPGSLRRSLTRPTPPTSTRSCGGSGRARPRFRSRLRRSWCSVATACRDARAVNRSPCPCGATPKPDCRMSSWRSSVGTRSKEVLNQTFSSSARAPANGNEKCAASNPSGARRRGRLHTL